MAVSSLCHKPTSTSPSVLTPDQTRREALQGEGAGCDAGREDRSLAAFRAGEISSRKRKANKKVKGQSETRPIAVFGSGHQALVKPNNAAVRAINSNSARCCAKKQRPAHRKQRDNQHLSYRFFSYSKIWILKIGTRDSASNRLPLCCLGFFHSERKWQPRSRSKTHP